MKMKLMTKTHFKDEDAVTMPETVTPPTLAVTHMHVYTDGWGCSASG